MSMWNPWRGCKQCVNKNVNYTKMILASWNKNIKAEIPDKYWGFRLFT